MAIPADAAQRLHGCVDTLACNPDYHSYSDTMERVGGNASYAQNKAITIFALDNAEVEKVPSAVRNPFLPVEPKDGHQDGHRRTEELLAPVLATFKDGCDMPDQVPAWHAPRTEQSALSGHLSAQVQAGGFEPGPSGEEALRG